MEKKKTKNSVKRFYHPDGYTYDEYSPGMQKRNFTDPARAKLFYEKYKKGGVGPERVKDHLKRTQERTKYIEENRDVRFTADGKRAYGQTSTERAASNKARGTQSSSTRRLIK